MINNEISYVDCKYLCKLFEKSKLVSSIEYDNEYFILDVICILHMFYAFYTLLYISRKRKSNQIDHLIPQLN